MSEVTSSSSPTSITTNGTGTMYVADPCGNIRGRLANA